jgi:hypothetical protein
VETFGWILDEHSISSSVEDQRKFRGWLQSRDSKNNVFWISGKPGAGKSTLMKYIAQHQGLQIELQSLGGAAPTIIEYYFWRHGAPFHRSSNGLLRSLLYQLLKAHPVLLQNAFPKREWVSGVSKFEFGQDSLYQSLKNVVHAAEHSNMRLFFLLDGLDEFQDDDQDEEESQEMELVNPLRILRILRSSVAMKLCVSSRTHNAFMKEFGSDPRQCFRLQDLTLRDIQTSIHMHLRKLGH